MLFSILAIFSFCASTSTVFQINNQQTNVSINSSSPASTVPHFFDLDSTGSRRSRVNPVLIIIDYVCLAFFSLEYLTLLICAPNPLKFLYSITAIIDILAILPDYIWLILEQFSANNNKTAITDILLLLRLMRVIRIFRIIRRVSGLWIMMYTLKASYKDLFLMLLFLLMGTLLFGSVIYFVDDTDVFTSIPHSFWWAMVTMTTVGYGDMVPTTLWGKLVGSVTTICGVLLIGFTIPSLVNNFTVYYNLAQFDARQKKLIAIKLERKTSEVNALNSDENSEVNDTHM